MPRYEAQPSDSKLEREEITFNPEGGLDGIFDQLLKLQKANQLLEGTSAEYSPAELATAVMEVCLAANRWKSPAQLGERLRKIDERKVSNEITDDEHSFLRFEAMGTLPVEDWPETRRLTRTGGFRESVISAIKLANPQDFVSPLSISDRVRAACNLLLLEK